MTRPYLLLNAVLYLALAVLCTVKHTQTSRGTGYVALDNSGHSEYLVIYGGLQIGLAVFFWYLASSISLYRVGIFFSLMLYAPIVIYRIVTVLSYSPVGKVTLGTAALEVLLLIGAIVIYFRGR